MRKATVFTIIICLFVLFPLTLNSQPPPPRKKVTVQKPSFTLKFPDKDMYFNRVYAMVFTPAGQLFTVNEEPSPTCVLWDVSNGKALRNFTLHQAAESEVFTGSEVFSLNRQFLSVKVGNRKGTAGIPDHVQIWDMVTGKHISNFRPALNWWGFSPDGKRFVSVVPDNSGKTSTLALWETGASGPYIRAFGDGQDGYKDVLIFSPDGKFLVTVVGTTRQRANVDIIYVWDTHTGKKIGTFAPSLNGFSSLWVRDLVVSPDGRGLAVKVNRIKNINDLNTHGDTETIELWDWSGKLLHSLKLRHGQSPAHIAISPDGRLIAATIRDDSGDFQNIVKLWDADTGEHIRTLLSSSGPVGRVVFSPDGQLLTCGTDESQVPLWNPHTGKIIAMLSHGQEGTDHGIYGTIFSPDGRFIAGTIGYTGTPIVWKIASDRDQGRYR